MLVGELFLNLGVKGADKTAKEIGNVKGQLSLTASEAFAATAAIVAAVAALSKMVGASMQAGTSLLNLNATTGANIETLEKWEYATKLVGGSASDMDSAFKSVQDTIGKMRMGGGIPEGLAKLQGIVDVDLDKVDDTFYLMGKLQEMYGKVSPVVANQILSGFGVGSGAVQAAMARQMYNKDIFAQAPVYGADNAKQLDRAKQSFTKISEMFEHEIGNVFAQHGPKIVEDVEAIVKSVIKLVDALSRLIESTKILKALSFVLEGWNLLLSSDKEGGGMAEVADNLDRWMSNTSASDVFKKGKDLVSDSVGSLFGGVSDKSEKAFNYIDQSKYNNPSKTQNQKGNIIINQNIEHHGDAKDTQAVKDSHKMGVRSAFQQSSALAGG